jgi:hypothetical protein
MIFLQDFIKFDQSISEKRAGQIWCGYYLLFWMNFVADLLWLRRSSIGSFVERDFFIRILFQVYFDYNNNKRRSPSNGKLSDFSFYIDSQKSAHRKFKK